MPAVVQIVLAVAGAAGLALVLVVAWQAALRARRVEEILTRTAETGARNVDVLALRQAVDARLDSFTSIITNATYAIDNKLAATTETITSVQRAVGEIMESTRRTQELGENIKRLQDILKPAPTRGAVGEILLENLLTQILPADIVFRQYQLGGEKVDFAVKIGEKYVPIDAKFPIEDYERFLTCDDAEKDGSLKSLVRNVEKKIQGIHDKYIKEDLGTYNFALMYLPSEGIYYEVFIGHPRLFDVAAQQHVFPCSPATMYVYLLTIAVGLRGLEVEKRAGVVVAQLQRLNKDLTKFRDAYDTLGTHLRNAANKYDEGNRVLNNFSDRLLATGRTETLAAEPVELPESPPLFPGK